MTIIARLRDIQRRHGLLGGLKLLPRTVTDIARNLSVKRRKALAAEREFDRKHGIDTLRKIPVSLLEADQDSKVHARPYQASGINFLLTTLNSIEIDHQNFTFLDLGSGKGRALLLAANFPFHQVIGVEFSQPLAELARQNIRSYRSNLQRCKSIEVVAVNAAEYALPETSLLIYIYNSFDDHVLRKVLENIQDSLNRNLRDILVLYVGDESVHSIFGQFRFLQLARTFNNSTFLYRNVLPVT